MLNGSAQLEFNRQEVERAYDRWAPVYDLVFGPVFGRGREIAIAATNRIGGRVLEVGVGTGISLSKYAHERLRVRRRYLGADAAQGAATRRRTAADRTSRGWP